MPNIVETMLFLDTTEDSFLIVIRCAFGGRETMITGS
jgi:hypothetical protein